MLRTRGDDGQQDTGKREALGEQGTGASWVAWFVCVYMRLCVMHVLSLTVDRSALMQAQKGNMIVYPICKEGKEEEEERQGEERE